MNSKIVKGRILYGINNIYTVEIRTETELLRIECRIKGKVLKESEAFYNPLAAGDIVEAEIHDNNSGLILSLCDRKNVFKRWNRKRMTLQLIAANLDVLFCITTPSQPPFRPRFIDRVLISAGNAFKSYIIINKTDLGVSSIIKERLDHFEKIGVSVIYCSAARNEGLDIIKEIMKGKYCAFVGQSGVGKSTLINALSDNALQKTGEISKKYNRGRHTTNYSIMIPGQESGIIDTPGIREIFIEYTKPGELASCFYDFKDYINNCEFSSCSHVAERGCAVIKAVENGWIDQDRYVTYMRLYSEMTDMREEVYGKTYN